MSTTTEVTVPGYITAQGEDRPSRVQVITAALWDVRDAAGTANVVEVARWVEAYLAGWERASLPSPESPESPTRTEEGA